MEREDGGGRRLLVTAEDDWHSSEMRPRVGLQSLGDDEQFMEAIFGGMLSQEDEASDDSVPPPPEERPVEDPTVIEERPAQDSMIIEEWPFSSIGSVESETEESDTPRGSEGSTVSMDEFPSAFTEVDTLEDAEPYVDVMFLDAPGPSCSAPEAPLAEERVSPLDMPGPSSLPPGTDYAPSAPPLPATLPYRYLCY